MYALLLAHLSVGWQSATMDSLKPSMLPVLQRPQSASDWMESSQGMDGRMQAYQDAVAAEACMHAPPCRRRAPHVR